MTYAEYCAEKCRYCRDRVPFYTDVDGNETNQHDLLEAEGRLVSCEATRDQFEQELQEEIEQLEEHAAALSQKLDTLSAPLSTCGCSYDAPAHVCMVHSPQLVAANIRISELERENAQLIEAVRRLLPLANDGFPVRGHKGPCGPNAGCDAICMDVATCAETLRFAHAAMQSAGEQRNG